MEDHDGGHAQGEDMHEVRGGFEDDRVGQLNTAGIAGRLDACLARDGRGRSDDGA